MILFNIYIGITVIFFLYFTMKHIMDPEFKSKEFNEDEEVVELGIAMIFGLIWPYIVIRALIRMFKTK